MALSIEAMTDRLAMLQGHKPDYSENLTVDGNVIAIASDVHIPYHHIPTVVRFMKVAEANNADAIVWLGDLLDNPVFSSWGNEDLDTNFQVELRQAEEIIRMAADHVPTQYWSMGNHERRWMRRVGFQGDMRMLALQAHLQDLMDDGRLIVSDSPTLEHYPRHADDSYGWMLVHPTQYGSKPLVVPGEIAEQYSMHVVSAHAHHWAQGVSKTGRFQIVESGGLFDERLVKYVQHQVTTHRAWTRGFVLLEDGNPRLFRSA